MSLVYVTKNHNTHDPWATIAVENPIRGFKFLTTNLDIDVTDMIDIMMPIMFSSSCNFFVLLQQVDDEQVLQFPHIHSQFSFLSAHTVF